jgi:hypothetical protein
MKYYREAPVVLNYFSCVQGFAHRWVTSICPHWSVEIYIPGRPLVGEQWRSLTFWLGKEGESL